MECIFKLNNREVSNFFSLWKTFKKIPGIRYIEKKKTRIPYRISEFSLEKVCNKCYLSFYKSDSKDEIDLTYNLM